ncbi:MAG: lipase [Glaciecola sp.]|jgi:lipase
MRLPELFEVQVDGGDLAVARWGTGPKVVLALHGITASHLNWLHVAQQFAEDEVTILAPDFRGRGASGTLPGPFGYDQHVKDLLAVMEHQGLDRVTIVGHSMGAFIAIKFAMTQAARVESLVLVDGGVPLAIPAGLDPDVVLAAILGPAMERLSKSFESLEACRDFWRVHPALAGDWSPEIEAYVDYDIREVDGAWVSRVNADAIRADGRDPLVDEALQHCLPTLGVKMRFFGAPRGLMNGDPLYPAGLVESLSSAIEDFEAQWAHDVNHYTITMSAQGSAQVAPVIRAALAEVD